MTTTDVSTSSTARKAALSGPGYQAFLLLRTVFTVAPICSNSTSSLEPVSRIMGRGRGARF